MKGPKLFLVSLQSPVGFNLNPIQSVFVSVSLVGGKPFGRIPIPFTRVYGASVWGRRNVEEGPTRPKRYYSGTFLALILAQNGPTWARAVFSRINRSP